MRRGPLLLLVLLAAGGCAKEEAEPLPVECTDVNAVEEALARAPGRVQVDGVLLRKLYIRNAAV